MFPLDMKGTIVKDESSNKGVALILTVLPLQTNDAQCLHKSSHGKNYILFGSSRNVLFQALNLFIIG